MLNFHFDRLYHGSSTLLAFGAVLKWRGQAYVDDWQATDFYAVLEFFRPEHCIAHKDAVFMVSSPDDIDAAGGATEWCAEVKPLGTCSRHDLNWCSEISCLISDGQACTSVAVQTAAHAYWAGEPHGLEAACVWEYLARSMQILRCESFDSLEENLPLSNQTP